ncbi:competence protein ComJ [Ectobacillus polymachus]|uniref:competence protein ComJ n=1 Tax=Ectobacillus polymachus TaxID=1508806 RepID=UPI003A8466C8
MQTLTISYNQLFVANEKSEVPVIDWTDEDLQKGYMVFDEGIVFEALCNTSCEITVSIGNIVQKEGALRIMSVPFDVTETTIIVYSILSEKLWFSVPKGSYNLSVQVIPLQKPTDDELYSIRYECYFTAIS